MKHELALKLKLYGRGWRLVSWPICESERNSEGLPLWFVAHAPPSVVNRNYTLKNNLQNKPKTCLSLSLHLRLYSHHSSSPYTPILPSDKTSPPVLFPSWRPLGRDFPTCCEAATPEIGARQRRLFLSSCSPLHVPCSTKTSHPASHPHITQHATTLQCHLLPAHTAPPHSHLYFGYEQPVPGVPLGFVSAAAKDGSTLSLTPTPLGKVYKRALVVPPSSPHQRAFVCGACTGAAQVSVWLVLLFDPLFKQSRLHCFHVRLTWYLWHMKVWWQYLHRHYGQYTGTLPYPTCCVYLLCLFS